MAPYKAQIAAAFFFLLISTSATLAFSPAAGYLIDHGFTKDNTEALNRSFLYMFAVAVVLGLAESYATGYIEPSIAVGRQRLGAGWFEPVGQDRRERHVERVERLLLGRVRADHLASVDRR